MAWAIFIIFEAKVMFFLFVEFTYSPKKMFKNRGQAMNMVFIHKAWGSSSNFYRFHS